MKRLKYISEHRLINFYSPIHTTLFYGNKDRTSALYLNSCAQITRRNALKGVVSYYYRHYEMK